MRKRSFARFVNALTSGRKTAPVKHKVRYFLEPFEGHETKRRCRFCASEAINWQCRSDQLGGIDKSSRSPVCADHRE